MKNKVCCIFNYGSHYRVGIYQLMDKELGCDFYLGSNLDGGIKQFDYNTLKGYVKSVKNIKISGHYYWQKGTVKLIFKPYSKIILTGEPYNISNWVILIIALFTKKETYLWSHGWYGRETIFKRFIKTVFFKLSTQVLLYGNHAKNLMIQNGFKESKLHCIYNSLDYDNQIRVRNLLAPSDIFKKHFANENPVLCYVGRIQKSKKLELIIDAMYQLKKDGFETNFVIVGEGSEQTGLIDYVKEKSLQKNVWFYGATYNELELGEIFYNSSICVSPGNVGLTAIHSLSYGCPIITHSNFSNQMPEFEAIISGVTGDFFIENDCQDLADKIKNWISLHSLNNIQLKEYCYKVIDEKYNPHAQISLLKKLFNCT